MVKNPPANAGDMGLIPGPGRTPEEGSGNPLQYSCLENTMDPCHAHGDLTSLAPHERLPELPVEPGQKPHTGTAARENQQDAPVIAR